MREIKFRAWDKEEKRMVKVDLTAMDGGLMPVDGKWDDTIWPFDSDDCILMQYTGLKDKNGREIYEGDILMNPQWWWGPCAIKYVSGQVGPSRGDNVMEWRLYRDKDIHNLWDGRDVEVIGNIYENPELVK